MDELRHKDVGNNLSQAEWEAIGSHIFNSQATGDMVIATSATQLSRLGVTNDRILVSSGGTFSWSNTLPAFTLGGDISAGGYHIKDVAELRGRTSSFLIIEDTAPDQYLQIRSFRTAANTGDCFFIATYNASDSSVNRVKLSGGIDTAVWTWTNTEQVGLKLGGALTLNGQDLVSDTSTGTKIGTATNQKIGFFGDTPVVQLAKASYNNWASLGDVVNALVAIGLFDVA